MSGLEKNKTRGKQDWQHKINLRVNLMQKINTEKFYNECP